MSAATPLLEQHRHCDDCFAAAEQAARAGQWQQALLALLQFNSEMEKHFLLEENTLFPAFEAATGMQQGPTMVMRAEHGEMRELMADMEQALRHQHGEDFQGAAETLLILMQQHNMKEENVLYPMCEAHVPNLAALLAEHGA